MPASKRKSSSRAVAFGVAAAALFALWFALRGNSKPPPKPFTRESALADAQREFPDARLPADALPAEVIAEEGVVYDAAQKLALDVYRPQAPGSYPLLLLVHGGGWERGSREMERPFAKQLAKKGYVVAPVSYRLAERGRFPLPLFDLKSAVRFLRANAARFSGDERRIAAIGASAGGQLVALLGASNERAEFEGSGPLRQQSSAVQAVIDIDGLADFSDAALLAKEERDPGAPTRFLGGSYPERAAVWRNASALTHVHAGSAPTLFLNSSAKTPILPGRERMKARLEELHVPSELVVVANTPHTFWLMSPWFERVLGECDAFLTRSLKREAARTGTGAVSP